MGVKWCVICSSCYEDSDIMNLDGAFNSISKLQTVIMSELGVAEEDAVFIYNKNLSEITSEIINFQNRLLENDIIIFYFCGHGMKIGNQLWLFANDTRRTNIELSSLNYKFLIDNFRKSKIKRIIAILDCCNSGAAINMGVKKQDIMNNGVTCEGEVILCSCADIETAIQREINHELHSVFTYIFSHVLSQGCNCDKEYLSIDDIMKLLKTSYETESGRTLLIDKKQELGGFDLIKNMHYVRQTSFEKSEELELIRAKLNKRKKWKILLVKCEIKYPTRGIDFGIPLGLWVLKNYISLAKPNVQVDIYDERLIAMDKREMNYEILVDEYDVIGVSMCTCEVPMAIEKLKIAHDKGKITVAGGIFTYSNEKYLINTNVVDYVIPGVGTVPWVRLLDALMVNCNEKKQIVNVNNVFSKNNMNTVVWLTGIMPGLEFHEWDAVLERYGHYINKEILVGTQKHSIPKIDIVTSRGCNKNCNFCSVRVEAGGSVIKRARYVVENEIDYLYSKGVRYFSIKDEDFFIHGKDRVSEIMQHCMQYKDIHFKIRMRLDAWEHFKNELDMETLRDWGVDEIQYGVESPQSDILRILQKGMTIDKSNIINLFQEHYKNGIKVNASFILGTTELEDSDYYDELNSFISKIYDEKFLIPYLNFYTPHPLHSSVLNDKYTVTTDDFNFYTHKIPVAFPKNMRQPERQKMIDTYGEITKNTKSQEFNPPIPEVAMIKFVKGKAVDAKKKLR